MIFHYAAALLDTGGPLEILAPGTPLIGVAAVVRLPDLGAKDRALLEVLAKAMVKGTDDYGRREMGMILDGRTVQVSVLPDSLVLQFEASKAQLKPALSLVNALLRRPTLQAEDLKSIAQSLERKEPDYWDIALKPTVAPAPGSVGHDQVEALRQRIFRPDQIQIAVEGDFTPGAPTEIWSRFTESWPAPHAPEFPDDTVPAVRSANVPGVTTSELRSPEFPASDAALITRLLAMEALGSGKSAPLFTVVREKHGWSYRQEALLWPTLRGWQPRFLYASIPTDQAPDRLEVVRKELISQAAAWTDEDLSRARAMLEANLERGVPFCPLNFNGRPIGTNLSGRVAWAAYWFEKTGQEWHVDRILKQTAAVSLPDLKQSAQEMLAGAKGLVLPGK